VTLTEHPDLAVHAGWTMRVDQAQELGQALLNAAAEQPERSSDAG
jgi:hypothetical protein